MMHYDISMNTGSTLALQDEDLLHLTLPGLLPEHARLIVDRRLHIVSLLHCQEGAARIRVNVQVFGY